MNNELLPYHLSYIFPDGQEAHYVFAAIPYLEKDFLAALKENKKVNLEDYGFVISSCYGNPPYEMKEQIRKLNQG